MKPLSQHNMISCMITLALVDALSFCGSLEAVRLSYEFGSGLKHYLHYSKVQLAQGTSACC